MSPNTKHLLLNSRLAWNSRNNGTLHLGNNALKRARRAYKKNPSDQSWEAYEAAHRWSDTLHKKAIKKVQG